MISEIFLSNVDKALSTFTEDPRKLPDVILFSIIESPGKNELEHHLEISESKLLRDMHNRGKLRYFSYLTRKELESESILNFVYGEEE